MLTKKFPDLRFLIWLKTKCGFIGLQRNDLHITQLKDQMLFVFVCLLKTMHCRIGMFYFPTQCVTVTFHKIMSSNLNDTNCTVWLQTLEIELTDLKENAINIVKWNSGETPTLFALKGEVVAEGGNGVVDVGDTCI